MNEHDASSAGSPPVPMDLQGRRRRAALLNALAKGSVLGAAVLPMSGGTTPRFGNVVDIPSGRDAT